MSTVSKCCSPWVPTSSCGKVTWGILVSAAITLLVIGILASQSIVTLSPPGAQVMMGVGGTILGLYVMNVLCCRCPDKDGWLKGKCCF
jgi:predicted exporter